MLAPVAKAEPMEITQIRFTNPTPDAAFLKERWLEPDDSFCTVCLNLSIDSAKGAQMLRPESIEVSDWEVDGCADIAILMCELAQSASESCSSCMVLLAAANALGQGQFDPQADREIWIVLTAGNMLQMSISADSVVSSRHSPDNVQIELFVLPGTPSPWPTIGSEASITFPSFWKLLGGDASIVPIHPTPRQCASVIRTFMKQCDEDHPYCDIESVFNIALNANSYRPRRLIDVGTSDSDILLLETPGQHAKYIALSYCWGTSIGLTLSKANRNELNSFMPWNKLLQTHKDAIEIARALGVQYLWVDALCIVQDDEEDKSAEIMHMAGIYRGAYLTISATGGIDGGDGLLLPRRPTHRIAVTNADGSEFDIWARWSLDHSPFRRGIGFEKPPNGERVPQITAIPYAKDEFPIFRRGWTFQERLLSPRIVHFGRQELVWECLGMTSCECGAMDNSVQSQILLERRFAAGIPHDVELRCGKLERSRGLAKRIGILDYGYLALPYRYTSDYALMFAMYGKRPEVLAEEPGYRAAWEEYAEESNMRWRNLVGQYSERVLGYAMDALPAISGFAQVWQARRELPTRYLAGLWEDDLPRGILWKAEGSEEMPRPIQYLAPTWSWACVRRGVSWLSSNHPPRYHAEIIDVSCETVYQDNVFGPVRKGHLTVKGLVLRSTFGGYYILEKNKSTYYPFPHITMSTLNGVHRDQFDSVPEVRDLAAGTEVFILWWSTDVFDERTGIGHERALILKRCEDAQDSNLMRIGVMSFSMNDETRELFEEATLTIV